MCLFYRCRVFYTVMAGMQGSILPQFVTLLEEQNGLAELEQREYLWERVQKGKKTIKRRVKKEIFSGVELQRISNEQSAFNARGPQYYRIFH